MAAIPLTPLIIDGQEIVTPGERQFDVFSAEQGKTVARAQGATQEIAINAVESAAIALPLWTKVKPTEKRLLFNRFAKV
jgi:acyl-CoA reductase-like NAD-dependent aldehyde dehydrogenase